MKKPTDKNAIVTTASELSKSEKDQIQTVLRAQFTQELSVSFETAADLLSGMRVEVGDWIYDGSGKKELDTLIKTLKS